MPTFWISKTAIPQGELFYLLRLMLLKICVEWDHQPLRKVKYLPCSKAEQPWPAASVLWGEGESLTRLLSGRSLSVPPLCRDELQEDSVGPEERLCHPLSLFHFLWSTCVHCKHQRERVHLLLRRTETGWVTTLRWAMPTTFPLRRGALGCISRLPPVIFDRANWYVTAASPSWSAKSKLTLPLFSYSVELGLDPPLVLKNCHVLRWYKIGVSYSNPTKALFTWTGL